MFQLCKLLEGIDGSQAHQKEAAQNYLEDIDESYLISEIEKRAMDINWAKTIEVVPLAIELRK